MAIPGASSSLRSSRCVPGATVKDNAVYLAPYGYRPRKPNKSSCRVGLSEAGTLLIEREIVAVILMIARSPCKDRFERREMTVDPLRQADSRKRVKESRMRIAIGGSMVSANVFW